MQLCTYIYECVHACVCKGCEWTCRHIIWMRMLCFGSPSVAGGVHAAASFVIMSVSLCFLFFLTLFSCPIKAEELLEKVGKSYQKESKTGE